MRVYLGSDHAGFELKQQIIEHLKETGHEPIDCGAFSYDPEDDYPAFCIAAATRTLADPGSLGIVLGGSGNGEAMMANRIRGVRCALCWNLESARLGREHNDANALSIGQRMIPVDLALEIVRIWLTTPFAGGRHLERIREIDQG